MHLEMGESRKIMSGASSILFEVGIHNLLLLIYLGVMGYHILLAGQYVTLRSGLTPRKTCPE